MIYKVCLYSFVEMVLLGKDVGRTLYIILILLLASILVYLLFAPSSFFILVHNIITLIRNKNPRLF